jgi:hypothetical protein
MLFEAKVDGVLVLGLRNQVLEVLVAPSIGGRVVSLKHLPSQRELLWRNPQLKLTTAPAGADYDSRFYGGIDELLPCDLPETIDGVDCPDHGELWTLALEATLGEQEILLVGTLPRFGLHYERQMRLEGSQLVCRYKLSNPTRATRHFLWKLHAAVQVQPLDRIVSSAQTALAADPQWSRAGNLGAFSWPDANGLDMSLVPKPDGTTEFLYLSGLTEGSMAFEAGDGARLESRFDLEVFPYCWYFASHGAMGGAYTAVLEPCTTTSVSVNQSISDHKVAILEPGESLVTEVRWIVGRWK